MISAFVLINAEPQSIVDLAETVAGIDGVREAHSVAGGEADLVAVLRVPDHEAIASTVTEHIARQPGVIATRTLIAFRSYSADQLAAGYEDFGD